MHVDIVAAKSSFEMVLIFSMTFSTQSLTIAVFLGYSPTSML